jgi:hypothetical protein
MQHAPAPIQRRARTVAELGTGHVMDPADEVESFHSIRARYAVLVIRDQQITDADQLRFARRFGPLELPPHMGSRAPTVRAA